MYNILDYSFIVLRQYCITAIREITHPVKGLQCTKYA